MAKHKEDKQEESADRGTLADALKSAAVKLGESGRTLAATSEIAQFRKRLIHTGRLEVDMKVRIPFESVLQVVGEPGMGKTQLSFILGGAAQRTCRQCFTPIITFYDDFKDREPVTTCQCGKADRMTLALFDLENVFDPLWAQVWGVQTSDFHKKPESFIEVAKGVQVSPDAKFVLARVPTLDHVNIVVKELLSNGAADMTIIDSIVAQQTREDADGKAQPGSKARAIAKIMDAVYSGRSACWMKHNFSPTVVMINQYRTKIGGLSPMADPRMAGGGFSVRYAAMQTYKMMTKYSGADGTYGGLQHIGETELSVYKDKITASQGDSAKYKSYLKPVSVSRVEYQPGDSDEGSKLWDIIKEMGEGGLGDKRWYHKSKKGHVILGREFTAVKDIVTFLNRPDIGYMLRLPIFALRFEPLQRQHLRAEMYTYSPFKDDPIMELINEATQRVGALVTVESGAGNPAPEKPEAAAARPRTGLSIDDPFDNDSERAEPEPVDAE